MNERIKELAEQATTQVTKPDGHYIVQEWQKVFAELIVRECADIACKHMELNEGIDFNIGDKIKQHFGVNSNEITTAMLDTAINQIEEYKKYVAQQQKENLPHISYGSWELYNKPKKEQE